ncbi:MAG: signal recognition particle-docking protein FtsY [bacterium]
MNLSGKIKHFFQNLSLTNLQLRSQDYENLRNLMLESDFGPHLTEELLAALRDKNLALKSYDQALSLLSQSLLSILNPETELKTSSVPPSIYLFVGVNGVGKTTSIAKMANYLKKKGNSVLLACADTFRAAAKEQLQTWAEQLRLPFVGYPIGGDPAAVVFDALEGAKSRKIDFLLIDTAGRQHTDTNLMEELKKIKRVISKKREGSPEEIMLVLDANSGLNAINQARSYHEALGLTGIIVTKFDSPAKAGFIFSLEKELSLPVKFLGVGEGLEDLIEFSPQAFIEKFLS